MTESVRFRFGKINPPGDLPSAEELANSIDDSWRVRDEKAVVEGEDPVPLEEKGRNVIYNDSHGDYSYCNFFYVSDKEDSATVRDGDELVVAPDQQPVRPNVFYFENGQFAYESEQGLIRHWVPQFIGERAGIDVDSNYHFDNFSQSTMANFYNTMDEISVFRFDSIDESFDGSSTLARALNELATEVDSQEFSGGNPPTNLKGLEIFDEAIEQMHVSKLRGARDDGYTTEILSSGMYQAKWSEDEWQLDAGQERRAEAMYQRIAPYLERLA